MIRLNVGIELPEVDMIEELSVAEHLPRVSQCLAQEGFITVVNPDGGLQFDAEGVDPAALDLAFGVCLLQYPVNPYFQLPLPRVQAERLYDHMVNVALPCLQRYADDHGLPALGEPPTLQTWLDSYYAAQAGDSSAQPWGPFGEIEASTNDDEALKQGAYVACEENPAGLYPEG